RLDFEIEALAKPFSNAEAEPGIQGNPKRRVVDDLGAAEAVEKSLDAHALRVGNRAERLDSAADVIDRLRGRAFRHRAFIRQPLDRRIDAVRLDSLPDFVAEVAYFL